MSSSRQLAAIMFTDIVGYTALMGRDEQKAFELLNKNRQIQKPIIEQFNGRWIKELGDGVLAQFNSAYDAVQCAVEIQKVARQELESHLRIGIHLGDVTNEDNDVFGDGVNVASLALMAVVTWRLGQAALVDFTTLGVAVVGTILLSLSRVNSAWVVLGGALVGLLLGRSY